MNLELPSPTSPLRSSHDKALILVADDDMDMRDNLRRLLRPLAEVVTAIDGREALTLFQDRIPDLVLSDLNMPHLDGFGLLRALRGDAATRHLPFIFLSSQSDEDTRNEALDLGANAYLSKPFSRAEVLMAVRTNLELSRLRYDSNPDLNGLKRSNEALQDFAFTAAHDLQEPVRKVRNFAGMLQRLLRDDPNPEKRDLISKVLEDAGRMTTLINDILNYARLTDLNQAFGATDLNDTLRGVLTDYELVIQEKNAVIELGTLPTIEGISFQLRQLFFNLMGNSLRFVLPGEAPQIRVAARQISPEEAQNFQLDPTAVYHDIRFADAGIGFKGEDAEKIFLLFTRLNNRQEYSGTGIGLALCRKIAGLHGGLIFAEMKEGPGAAFHIILPEKQPVLYGKGGGRK